MKRITTAAVLVTALLTAGCGDDSSQTIDTTDTTGTAPAAATVPTPTELSQMLLTGDDLGAGWSMQSPPEGAFPPDLTADERASAEAGVVLDSFRDLLPQLEFCDAASEESAAAADALAWQAFRPLDLAVDDTIEPPNDRVGYMVFLQEFLLADDPDVITATFDALRDGALACLGPIEAGEEGPGMATVMSMPEIGDDRVGVLLVVEEAGAWADWRIHNVLVRDGAVLAWFSVVDIVAGLDPYFTEADVVDIVDTGVEQF